MRDSAPLKDILRLLWLIVLLPLLLLLVGPLLVLAAIFGRLSLFNIQLNPGKHFSGGRAWAFVVGLLLWATIWPGLAWLLTGGQLPLMTAARQPAAAVPVAAPATPTPRPSFTPTPAPDDAAEAVVLPTATLVVATDTPLLPPSATFTPLPLPTATLRPTSPPPTATATRVLPPSTLSSEEEAEALQSIIHANNLLVAVMVKPDGQNTSALSLRWRGAALAKVQTFAQDVNQKYNAPLTIRYSTIGVPQISVNAQTGRLQVSSREFWTFESPSATREALVDYQYTLQNINGRRLVVEYDFEVVPLPGNPNAINTTAELAN